MSTNSENKNVENKLLKQPRNQKQELSYRCISCYALLQFKVTDLIKCPHCMSRTVYKIRSSDSQSFLLAR